MSIVQLKDPRADSLQKQRAESADNACVVFDIAALRRKMPSHRPCKVSAREAEVLDLAHLTYREIGEQLGIAEATVRCHMRAARTRLGAESARAAVAIWNTARAA